MGVGALSVLAEASPGAQAASAIGIGTAAVSQDYAVVVQAGSALGVGTGTALPIEVTVSATASALGSVIEGIPGVAPMAIGPVAVPAFGTAEASSPLALSSPAPVLTGPSVAAVGATVAPTVSSVAPVDVQAHAALGTALVASAPTSATSTVAGEVVAIGTASAVRDTAVPLYNVVGAARTTAVLIASSCSVSIGTGATCASLAVGVRALPVPQTGTRAVARAPEGPGLGGLPVVATGLLSASAQACGTATLPGLSLALSVHCAPALALGTVAGASRVASYVAGPAMGTGLSVPGFAGGGGTTVEAAVGVAIASHMQAIAFIITTPVLVLPVDQLQDWQFSDVNTATPS